MPRIIFSMGYKEICQAEASRWFAHLTHPHYPVLRYTPSEDRSTGFSLGYVKRHQGEFPGEVLDHLREGGMIMAKKAEKEEGAGTKALLAKLTKPKERKEKPVETPKKESRRKALKVKVTAKDAKKCVEALAKRAKAAKTHLADCKKKGSGVATAEATLRRLRMQEENRKGGGVLVLRPAHEEILKNGSVASHKASYYWTRPPQT